MGCESSKSQSRGHKKQTNKKPSPKEGPTCVEYNVDVPPKLKGRCRNRTETLLYFLFKATLNWFA